MVPSYKWLLRTRNVVSANEKPNLYILFNFYLNLNNHTVSGYRISTDLESSKLKNPDGLGNHSSYSVPFTSRKPPHLERLEGLL